MKTIKSSKDITTLEVGDKVIFGDLEYVVICSVVPTISCQRVLSFPTEKLANQFLINFKDLLEIAKPLL